MLGVEVGHAVFSVEHPDHNAEEGRDHRHIKMRLRPRDA
jgi:hypothetical protein